MKGTLVLKLIDYLQKKFPSEMLGGDPKHILVYKRTKNKLEILLTQKEKTQVVVKDYQEHALSPKEIVNDSVKWIDKVISENKVKPSFILPILPLSACFVRKLRFPYTSLSKIKRTVKFALEPHIPLPIEEIKEFFLPLRKIGGSMEVLCFALKKSLLEEEKQILDQVGTNCYEMYLSPLAFFSALSNLLPEKEEVLWIDVREDNTYLLMVKGAKLMNLRELPYGDKHLSSEAQEWERDIDLFVHSHYGDKPDAGVAKIIVTGISQNLPKAMLESQKSKLKILNLEKHIPLEKENLTVIPRLMYEIQEKRGGQNLNFYPSGVREAERKQLLISLVLAGLILLIATVRLSTQRIIEGNRYTYLTSKIENIFKEAFPQVKDTRAPLLQMQSRLKELQGQSAGLLSISMDKGSALNVLREISSRIDRSLEVQLDSLYIGEDEVTLAGTTQSYQKVDEVKRNLASSALFSRVEIQSADSKKEKVQFRLELKIAQ